MFLFSSDPYPGVEFLDNITVLFLIFWRTFVLFSTVAVPIYISTNSAGWFPFVYILSSACYFLFVCLFYDIHSDRYKVISHCGFDLFLYLLATCMSSLEKKCYAGLLPIFIFYFFPRYSVSWVLYVFWMLERGTLTLPLSRSLLCSPARKPEYCPRQI